jgi:hypothetical protein
MDGRIEDYKGYSFSLDDNNNILVIKDGVIRNGVTMNSEIDIDKTERISACIRALKSWIDYKDGVN